MSTMQVFFDLSRFSNQLVGFSVVLLVTVCVSSTKPSERSVRFPEDTIVFPSEKTIETKEKRSENEQYRQAGPFQHNPEFHKFNHPPFPLGRIEVSPHPPFEHSLEFHHQHESRKIPAQVLEYKNQTVNTIPLDLIQDINQFNNVSEVLQNFVEADERIHSESAFLADRFGTDERNAAITPKSAGCMPELHSVKLASSDDASVLYIPQCTRIERCGGCCSHHLLSCQPTEVQPVSFSVMKTQYVGGKKLKFMGKEIVVIEKHTKCKCDCKLKAKDCNRFQQYKKSECRCVCTNSDEEKKCYRKNQTKLWDPELCSCVCREVNPCSTGYEFDPIECRCGPVPTRDGYPEAYPRVDYDE